MSQRWSMLVVCALLLSACGGGDTSVDTSGPPSTPTTVVVANTTVAPNTTAPSDSSETELFTGTACGAPVSYTLGGDERIVVFRDPSEGLTALMLLDGELFDPEDESAWQAYAASSDTLLVLAFVRPQPATPHTVTAIYDSFFAGRGSGVLSFVEDDVDATIDIVALDLTSQTIEVDFRIPVSGRSSEYPLDFMDYEECHLGVITGSFGGPFELIDFDEYPGPPTTSTDSSTQPTIPPSTGVVEPNLVGAVTLGPPDPDLLSASPSGEIDWAAVGPGWLLIDHPMRSLAPSDPPTVNRRGIYLVAPDDTVYGVSALPNDGSWVADVSDDGRQVLLQQFDDACAEGCECPADMAVEAQAYGYALLDLPTTSLRSVIDPVPLSVCGANPFYREVGFTNDGTGIWVTETWYNGGYHATRVRLSRVDIATGAWTELLAEPVEVDETEPPSSTEISVVELDDGRIVVDTPTGSWVRGADGSPWRELDVPHAGCKIQRIWDADHVLARCPASASEFPLPPEVPIDQCYASGLWLVAVDGAPPQLLAVPLNNGYVHCWSGYGRAEQLGDELAVGVGGDGCSDDVVLIAADGTVTRWLPDFADSCTESLLGVRGAAWLISASPDDGATVVYEVTPQGSTRIELPPGWITVIGSTGR